MKRIYSLLAALAIVSTCAPAFAQTESSGPNPIVGRISGNGNATGDIHLLGIYKLTLDADKNSFWWSPADNQAELQLNGLKLVRIQRGTSPARVDLIFRSGDGQLWCEDDGGNMCSLRTGIMVFSDGTGQGDKGLITNAGSGTTLSAGVAVGQSFTDKGMRLLIRTASTTVSFPGNPGAASVDTSGLVPAGAVVVGITTRVSVAPTNCATYSVGDNSGAAPTRFATGRSIALGTTSDTTNAAAVGDILFARTTAMEARITGNVNCFNGTFNVVANYLLPTAPTSN